MTDVKDGAVLGTIDLGGVPEQGVADGKGILCVVMQDAQGSVTAVDIKAMKAVAHYPLGDKGRSNGLALDARNPVLFAACSNSGNPPDQAAQPMMVVLSAKDGKILTSLPLAGGSNRRCLTLQPMKPSARTGTARSQLSKRTVRPASK